MPVPHKKKKRSWGSGAARLFSWGKHTKFPEFLGTQKYAYKLRCFYRNFEEQKKANYANYKIFVIFRLFYSVLRDNSEILIKILNISIFDFISKFKNLPQISDFSEGPSPLPRLLRHCPGGATGSYLCHNHTLWGVNNNPDDDELDDFRFLLSIKIM